MIPKLQTTWSILDYISDLPEITWPIVPSKKEDNLNWKAKMEDTGDAKTNVKNFAETIYPLVKQFLIDKGLPLTNLDNMVRLLAIESKYGTDPRGSQGFNLGGIKWTPEAKKYKHTTHTDGNEYIDFDDLYEYLNYFVSTILKWDALNATSSLNYVDRLHPQSSGYDKSNKLEYSTNYKGYRKMFGDMRTLNNILQTYHIPYVTAKKYGGKLNYLDFYG